jgi:hypothetical protein
VRSALVVAVLAMVTSGVALAQTTTPSSSTSSKIADAFQWRSKQWHWAKAEWEKQMEKWADCRKQSNDQNLSGPKSWSFLASCMAPSSSISSKINDVSTRTSKQWNWAKAEWAKEKQKWADCEKRSRDKI